MTSSASSALLTPAEATDHIIGPASAQARVAFSISGSMSPAAAPACCHEGIDVLLLAAGGNNVVLPGGLIAAEANR